MNTMTTAAAAQEPEAASAVPRLNALEAEATPLRARVTEIDAEIAKLDAEIDPASLPKALAARRARAAKKADLDLERGLLVDRLSPLENEIGPLRETAKVEARWAEAEQFRSDLMEAIEALTPSVEKLGEDLDELAEQLRVCRRSGHSAGMEVQRAIGAMVGPLGKTLLVLRGRLLF